MSQLLYQPTSAVDESLLRSHAHAFTRYRKFDFIRYDINKKLSFLGIAVRLRVIRQGVEVKSTMKDDHYDFNYQNPILVTNPLELLPVRK